MWIVPDQFNSDILEDEDQRLQKITDHLMVWGDFGTLRAWKNRTWNSLFKLKADDESFTLEYASTVQGCLMHEPPSEVEETEDIYSDLPFLAKEPIEGHYLYVSGWLWEEELQASTADLSSKLPIDIKYWPTPTARNHNDYNANHPMPAHKGMGLTMEQRNLMHITLGLFWRTGQYKTHNFNLKWLDQVMGLPVGWSLLVDEMNKTE